MPVSESLDIIYFAILITAVVAAFKACAAVIPGLIFLQVLLLLAFINEVAAIAMEYKGLNHDFTHYFYIPAEYLLLVLFYNKSVSKRYFKIMLIISAVIVFAFAIYVIFKGNADSYPGFLYNLSCGFNTLWTALLLLNLKVEDGHTITSIPIFWILTAFLIFYSGIFFFNTGYRLVLIQDKQLADELRTFISTGLNIILYLLLIYGFRCSCKTKKY